MAEKIYTKGLFANEKSSQFGNFMAIDLKADEFIAWVKENTNAKGYCKITIYKAKDGGKNTHYGVLNDFTPQETKVNERPINVADESDDLPF